VNDLVSFGDISMVLQVQCGGTGKDADIHSEVHSKKVRSSTVWDQSELCKAEYVSYRYLRTCVDVVFVHGVENSGLTCVRGVFRAALKQLKQERIKKYDYCLPCECALSQCSQF
jgi:hypothetical protein